jgi:hypothetical protein
MPVNHTTSHSNSNSDSFPVCTLASRDPPHPILELALIGRKQGSRIFSSPFDAPTLPHDRQLDQLSHTRARTLKYQAQLTVLLTIWQLIMREVCALDD